MRLSNKVAIVTGSARGLGKGIALKLAQDGAKVVVCDIDINAARACAQEIIDANYEAYAIELNVADNDSVKNLFEKTIEKYKKIDIVVNNAGINRDSMLHKMTLENWDQVIAVNLTGTFYITKEAAKIMREQNSGRIINISSASWQGNIGQANYSAAKAGVIGLTKTAARELARKNVTVNAICPGFIETDMTKGVPDKVWDMMVAKIPLGRVGQPSDVANMVAFLSSDEAAYITAEVINVGGGMIL